MEPSELLLPLEGQRDETLEVIDSLAESDLNRTVRGEMTIRGLLRHVIDREYGIAFAIMAALDGEVVHLSQEDRDQVRRAEHDETGGDWDRARFRAGLLESRAELRRVFATMREDDLDLPIRWPEWPARTIRTSIPYMLEHEDSHLDELREALAD